MEKLKVSIIVPVYNTKIEYFRQCMESLVSQTYGSIEIVIVDDGSKDDNAALYEQYIMPYKNVKFVRQKNRGVSAARNKGIESSTGECIAFVDSDDWVEPQFIEALVEGIEGRELSAIGIDYEDGIRRKETIKAIPSQELWSDLLYSTEIGGFLCNKLFRKELITQKLNEGLFYSEDFVFTAEYCRKVKTAGFNSRQLYHYRPNPNSASNDFTFNRKILSLLDSYTELEKIYAEESPDNLLQVLVNLYKIALNFRARYLLNKIDDPAGREKIWKTIRKYRGVAMKCPSMKERVNMRLTYCFPVAMFKIKCKVLGRNIR